jgi:hypothetical protein
LTPPPITHHGSASNLFTWKLRRCSTHA